MYDAWFSVIERPITAGSPPKRRFHRPAPITTTGGASGRPSSGRNTRPAAACTPSTSNSEAEARRPCSSSASPGAGETRPPHLRRGHRTEAVVAIAEIQVVGRGQGEGAAVLLAALQNHGQPARVPVRQRAQQHRVDQAEDRRIGADAERQHQDRRQRESRRLRKHTQAVNQVPSHAPLDAGRRPAVSAPPPVRWRLRRGPPTRSRPVSNGRSSCRSR